MVNKQGEIEMICEEMKELSWMNRAMKHQIAINENRIYELDNRLAKLQEKSDGKDIG